jgi:hypothetical protein
MRNILLFLSIVFTIGCSKEDLLEDTIEITPPNRFEISISPVKIDHQYTSYIVLGLDIAVHGAVNYLDNTGTEHLILAPSPSRWPLAETYPLPTLVFNKQQGSWSNPQYFNDINMGMGGRDVFEFGQGGWLWADTGPEIIDAPYPMNHLYVSKTVNRVTSWTQVSEYKSFYHGGSAGDLNYDGLLDVVGINLTPSENPDGERIHTYLQNQDGSFTQKRIIDVTVGTSDCMYSDSPDANCPSFAGSSVLIHDVDNDGYPEIIKGSSIRFDTDRIQNSLEIYTDKDKDGMYSMLEFTPLMSFWLDTNYAASQIKPYDYDQDGDEDLFVFFENTRTESIFGLGVLRNKGDGRFEDTGIKIELPLSDFLAREFELLDFDYDGDLDIIFNYLPEWPTPEEYIFNTVTNEVDLSKLIWENVNGTFQRTSQDLKVTVPDTKTIGFLKGMEVNNQFKFIGIQRLEPYSDGNVNILEIKFNN